ncbi:MAG TPA: hypothetical protein VK826_18875 [Bacteroidia bacterium]|nr:hypothetical protein [Bacteroidia bacterium]
MCAHAQMIVPDSTHLGMKPADFEKMYVVDTMCKREGEKMFLQHAVTDTLLIGKVNALVKYLDSTSYWALFFRGSYTKADSIWYADTSGSVLKQIVQRDDLNKCTQFFAAEILMQHSDWKPEGPLLKKVAELYATALRENYAEVGNPWGRPDDVGDIGRRIARMGDAVVVAFRPLLKCKTTVYYAGSKRGRKGRYTKYRVKDIAASHICAIRNIEFDGDCKRWKRNMQIRKLRRKL